ncbi:ABC transporter permease subunit [Curtobacterium sp. VKM Ac-2861]|nr:MULTISPECIES: ABC transporter permease subunit [unclassified Curtobacterium]MBT1623136.1 ABC transporter permease subunit [Curtobacterium flaccumfaciens pv. oortii]NQW92390.1 ABC transporter permease subunit [Curtobacterium sp. VKM Ac-2861]
MNWIIANFGLVWGLTVTHAGLAAVPIVLGFVVAVPLGWVANRWQAVRSVIVGGGSLLYTIPSLPLFVILPYLLGTRITDPVNIVVGLSVYAVAIMVRLAADAFAAVPADVVDSATSVGYSAWGRFWTVELPLAGPVLLAGMRVVSASTVALVSVGALVGSANIGFLFTDGRQRQFLEEILVGVAASLFVALVFDTVLVALGRVLMPWSRRIQVRSRRSRRRAALATIERGA